jgi:hypothetical protein
MAPDPDGERIARLETGASAAERNVERIEKKLDEALQRLSTIEKSINRHHGVDGVVVWIADAARLVVAGIAGAAASILMGRH